MAEIHLAWAQEEDMGCVTPEFYKAMLNAVNLEAAGVVNTDCHSKAGARQKQFAESP